MNPEEQANLSYREMAMRTKEKIRMMGLKSPNHLAMYGLQTDDRTTWYFQDALRRAHFITKYGLKEFKLIKPKSRGTKRTA